ncbi:uncharacterized protein PRCAT00004312001 [Priceomyces carsonii]|uniref:uncharacterized protein n=1 Tax=Priceomyces carsonii TaxID=28549 RepID=UPI002EDA7007|nr:unnamed protein product [Priceomyces carsonii]
MTTITTLEENISIKGETSKGYTVGNRGAQNMAFGGKHPFIIPSFKTKLEERKFALEHAAGAFRVFARKGFSEGEAGHISIRDPVHPDTFWINPLGKHFALIKASDLVHVDEKGHILPDGNQSPINAAGFSIHSALHKARPDVNAACHTHSVYGKAYSSFGKPLEMLNQDACIFYGNQAVYLDFGGVAIEGDEGKEIAKASGNSRAIILQNHGLLTLGSTIDEAAYLYTLLERCCEVQLLADSSSSDEKPKIIIPDEAALYSAYVTNDPETLYASFQPDFELEKKLSGGEFLQ